MAEVNPPVVVDKPAQEPPSSAANNTASPTTPEDQQKPQALGGAEEKSWLTYVFIGVLTVALVLLLYYAYGRFVSNSIEEPMTKGVEQERDDPVVDFNLREAIRDLQGIQQRVLSTLSETMNI